MLLLLLLCETEIIRNNGRNLCVLCISVTLQGCNSSLLTKFRCCFVNLHGIATKLQTLNLHWCRDPPGLRDFSSKSLQQHVKSSPNASRPRFQGGSKSHSRSSL